MITAAMKRQPEVEQEAEEKDAIIAEQQAMTEAERAEIEEPSKRIRELDAEAADAAEHDNIAENLSIRSNGYLMHKLLKGMREIGANKDKLAGIPEDAAADNDADEDAMEEAVSESNKNKDARDYIERDSEIRKYKQAAKLERAAGEESLARLIKLLRSAGRNDLVDAVLDDPSRRAELMAEHGIG